MGDPRAVEPLIRAMADENKWVRRDVSTALSRMGDEAFEPLLESLSNEDWRIRGAAAWIIGNFQDERAVEPLIKLLEDDSGFVRSGAARSLEQIGGERVRAAMEKLAETGTGFARKVAVNYLETH
ncbi:HEAT repeat domain-containing protein [Methanothermobacter thermautotrophicus]|uniref:HEAT repeat domain-containing protein n=1 Tax=Methanothermobacter thermautotrophicus TaxID=145262 RepID=UPI003D7F6894